MGLSILCIRFKPEYRRRGIGTRLVDMAVEVLRSHNIRAVIAITIKDSVGQAFFSSLGFEDKLEFKSPLSDRTLVLMVKRM